MGRFYFSDLIIVFSYGHHIVANCVTLHYIRMCIKRILINKFANDVTITSSVNSTFGELQIFVEMPSS